MHHPKIGIYRIENVVTNQFYIGSAAGKYGIKKRLNDHLLKLKKNIHANSKLQNNWNKYGENNFIFSIVELCSKEQAIKKEQYYIDTLKPYLNINLCANSRLGMKHKDETKKKLSIYFKNRIMTEDHKNKISKSLTGLKKGPMSQKRKDKVSRKTIIINFIDNISIGFRSLNAAADYLNVTHTCIKNALKYNYKIQKKFKVVDMSSFNWENI